MLKAELEKERKTACRILEKTCHSFRNVRQRLHKKIRLIDALLEII